MTEVTADDARAFLDHLLVSVLPEGEQAEVRIVRGRRGKNLSVAVTEADMAVLDADEGKLGHALVAAFDAWSYKHRARIRVHIGTGSDEEAVEDDEGSEDES